MAYFKCKSDFKGYIDVYGIANALLTATTGTKSYTATANASGYARIKVRKKGTYTITSNSTLRVAHATVSGSTPVTAYYIWGKYTIGTKYVEYTRSESSGSWQSYLTYSSAYLMYATGYHIDQENGRFVLDGVTYQTSAYNWHSALKNNNSYKVCGNMSGSYMKPINCGSYGSGIAWGLYGDSIAWDTSQSEIHTSSGNDTCTTSFVKILGLTTQQTQGTFIENVTSTSIDAYPTNGVSGSNWYTAA